MTNKSIAKSMHEPMVESYQVTTRGLMDGFSSDQVVDMLVILFKRSRKEIQSMLKSDGFVVKKGMGLPDAIKYKVALEQRGCRCSIDPYIKSDTKPDQVASQFPDTVRNENYMSPITEPFIDDAAGFELRMMDIERPAEPAAEAPPPQMQHGVEVKEPVPIRSLSVTNEVGTTVSGDPFFVQTPEDLCCNCGTRHDVSLLETRFVKHLVFSTRFESEQEIALDLPYCPSCAEQVGNYPMTPALKWLIAFGIWFMGLMLLMSQFALPQKYVAVRMLLLIVPLIPAALAFRWIGKPTAPQTSKYTPVIIKEYSRNPNATRQEGRAMVLVSIIAQLLGWFYKKVSDHDPDRIKVLTMKFSNRDYARAFKKINKSFIQNGYIRVL